MKMPKKKKKAVVPRLRFPEFRDAGEWEVKRLGNEEISQFIRDRILPENIPIGHYVSTINLLPDFGRLATEPETPPPNNAVAYREGDILISNIRPYLKKVWIADRSGGASNDVLVVRAGKDIVSAYLSHLLMSDQFIAHVMEGVKGVKMPRGDQEQIQDFRISVPPKPEEQQKIADCLASLDDLIRALKAQLVALKDHKKGLMQQLFPREGETTPRLRFPEFRDAGEWEVKRLGEVCEINPPSKVLLTKFIYIDLESIKDGRLTQKKIITKSSAPSRAQRLLEKGDIIYQMVRPYQKNNFLFYINDEILYVASTGYAQLRAHGSNTFLYQLVHTEPFTNSVLEKCTGSNYPAISSSDLSDVFTALPATLEQQKIADCLASLDDLIRAGEAQLVALKDHKKGLMQQLFPQEVG